MHRSGLASVAAAGVAALLLVAGCGSSASKTSGSNGASGKPINIGVIVTLSGVNAQPEAAVGAQSAAAAINKAGGIGGHPIHVVLCDDQTNPNAGAECGSKMASAHVVAVDAYGSQGNSYEPALRAANIPELTAFAQTSDEQTFSNVYPISATTVNTVGAGAALCAKLGAKKIGVPRIDIPTTAALMPGIYSALQDFGLDRSSVNEVDVPGSATDLSSYVAAATRGTQCLVQVESPDQQVLFNQQEETQGSHLPDVSTGGTVPPVRLQSLKNDTDIYEDFLLPDPTFTSTAGIKQFLSEVHAYGTHGHPLDAQMLSTWAGMRLAAKYINPNDASGTALMHALNGAGTINMPPLPPLDFAKNVSPIKGLRIFTTGTIFAHWVNGKFVPYFGGRYQTLQQLKAGPALNG